jgi:hypothetical protein
MVVVDGAFPGRKEERMSLHKLDFGDSDGIIGHVDLYDRQQVIGWIASRDEIRAVEFVEDGSGLNTKVEHGLDRPDVQRTFGRDYRQAGRSGFRFGYRGQQLEGSFVVTCSTGKWKSKPISVDLVEDDASYLHKDVPSANLVSHAKWRDFLLKLANDNEMRVLEIGSRLVTRAKPFGKDLSGAEYVGFDLYEGPNVDVVGDAHKLSAYFDERFDLIFSSAVFEHLAMPWIVAEEIAKLLNLGGYVFVETHYSYSSHERPWHFFQFSEEALKVLFSPAMGFECIEAGVSNPITARFSSFADSYLAGRRVTGLYCHSEYLGRKVKEVSGFRWREAWFGAIAGASAYPDPSRQE